ncbi:unnamed protein product [Mytilus edulis]|uniref:Uncharacterized protein n=1 Tax=Mytilus edulis TaxID=6550 RepID=A0A8S3QGD6_MYTED|nr:unnamed protein product [Mytilus edulis]
MFLIIILRFSYVYCSSCHITGNAKSKVADCSLRGFLSVPRDLPDDIVKLDLRGNEIVNITAQAFIRYRTLQVLILNNNKISYLEDNTFAGLGTLDKLSMFGNNLDTNESYPLDIFSPLVSLTTLNISRNMKNTNRKTVFYPSFGELYNLTNLAVDLTGDSVFNMSGSNLTKLNTLLFDCCYLDRMTNKTFFDMPSSIVSITFTGHDGCTIFSVAEADFLRPFPSLRILRLKRVCLELESALKMLYPFRKQKNE